MRADAPVMTEGHDEGAQELRAAILKLKAPVVAQRAPAPTSSVYGRAAAAVPDDVRPSTSRADLDARFRNVETNALIARTTMGLVVLPDRGPVPAPLMHDLELLVASGAIVLVLGPEIPRQVDPRSVMTLPLRKDDHLANEWAVLALGPAERSGFLAQRDGDQSNHWHWMMTHDAVAVGRAATAILERAPFLRLRVPLLQD